MNTPQNTKPSFFSILAWYAVFSPFAAVILAFGIHYASWHTSDFSVYNSYYLGLCISATSVLASLVCLFGIRNHGWRVIIWKSSVGFCLGGLALLWIWAVLVSLGQIANQ
jgi:hypothetical protein